MGLFLLTRVMRDGGDSRFDEVKTQPGKFLVYWTLQGVWVWVTALPVFLINGIGRQSPLFWGDYLSLALWVAGFICETTADYQKYKFKQDPANKGRFINTGLWSLSRHPNYFGEILMWWAVAGVAVSMNASPLVSVAALASPLFVTFLLTQVGNWERGAGLGLGPGVAPGVEGSDSSLACLPRNKSHSQDG
jgi:steroid 5-alpha reductase family enzyme